jgi:UPF0716 protein FxsA
MPILILLFVVIPLTELFILLQVAEIIGGWYTFGLVIATGIAGGYLVRVVGLNTLMRIQREWQSGKIPADQIVDGLIILVGAAFLLTPGIMTDIAGISTLFPPTRAFYRGLIKKWLKKKIQLGQASMHMGGFGADSATDNAPVDSEEELPPNKPASSGADAEFDEDVFERFDKKQD